MKNDEGKRWDLTIQKVGVKYKPSYVYRRPFIFSETVSCSVNRPDMSINLICDKTYQKLKQPDI